MVSITDFAHGNETLLYPLVGCAAARSYSIICHMFDRSVCFTRRSRRSERTYHSIQMMRYWLQLANTSFATNTGISSLEAVYPQVKTYENSFLRHLANPVPPLRLIFAVNYRGTDDDLVALIQRRMIRGDFTRHRRDRDIEAGKL